jgi:DNA invertase Pin-like site-specific DNA recombinase
MKDATGYVRVSSEEQADSGLGLDAQRQRIVAFCDMKESSVVCAVRVEPKDHRVAASRPRLVAVLNLLPRPLGPCGRDGQPLV